MGVVPQATTQSSVQKKKVAAAASSSDSDSSDDEQPASKKPALVKASPSVSKSGATVVVGGKKVVGKPASSSSESESSDERGVGLVKKPVGVVGGGVKPTMGVVPQATTQSSVQKKKVAAAASSSDSDSSDDEQPASKKPALVKASPSVSKSGATVVVGGKKFFPNSVLPSFDSNISNNLSVGFPRKRRFSFSRNSCTSSDNLICNSMTFASPDFQSSVCNGLSVLKSSNSSNVPFRRVEENAIYVHPNLRDNSFEAMRNSRGSWGERANRDFKFTSGKVFKQEKTKKKRGSYVGGSLSLDSCSFKFNE
uniref:Nucleolar phosphoprotein p130 n=1 Tax=Schistosoma japonicum TaxID=6182 RepID=C1LF85_SCHJA|nr:Nucleolar phosphoprotein p130 [Schistosoma japonicum]